MTATVRKAAMPLAQMLRGMEQGVWALLAVALGCAVTVALAPEGRLRLAAGVIGITFSVLVLAIRALLLREALGFRRLSRDLKALVGGDAAPCFTTDGTGMIGFQNHAAAVRFGPRDGMTLIATLRDHFASPASVLYRLQSRAMNHGSAREDVVTRHGHTRLSVHRIGPARFLWRLEEFLDRGGAGRGAETLSLPMLTANRNGVILFANEALRRLVGGRPKRLDRLFAAQVLRPGEEIEVATEAGPVRAILAEVEGSGERREIYLLPTLVLDTNTVLALWMFRDPALETLRAWIDAGSCRLVSRADALEELRRVLAYAQFGLDPDRQDGLRTRYLARIAVLANDADAGTLPGCRDPDDQKFLEIAGAAGMATRVSSMP